MMVFYVYIRRLMQFRIHSFKCTICAKKFTLELDLVEHESDEHWNIITR